MDDPFTGGFDTGFDDATGFGFVRADAAVASVISTSISGVAFHDFNGNGTMEGGESAVAGATIFIDANNNGSLDGGELSAVTSGSGSYTINGVTGGPYTLREIAPSGFVSTTINNVTVTGTPLTAVNFANIATTYTGTGASDVYRIRRKAADTKFEILIGGVVTYTIPASVTAPLSFNLAGAADSFTIDAINGSAIPGGGITIDGGAGGDALAMLGTAAAESAIFNAGTITFGGAIAYSSVESVSFDGNGGKDIVSINSGTVAFTAPQVLQSLSISPSAKVDLRDNSLVIDYDGVSPIGSWGGTSYTGITGLIQSGRNGGTWNGSGIVTSDTRAINSNDLTTLAVAEASKVLDFSASPTALFSGQTVDATSVLVKFTWGGDANLDGKINVDDYGQIDFNAGSSGSVFGWFNGDFNFDGKINVDDYGIIDFNVSAQTGVL
ncbi:MAG: SdrD B-like domain-containing protein, partial [Tepidisphaeraceae bacterium]